MKSRVTVLSAAIFAAIVVSPLASQAAELRTARHPVPGEYIVVLKDSAASLAHENNRIARVAAVAGQIAGEHRARLKRSYDRVLRGFAVEADHAALTRLLADPRVAYVEENGYVHANPTQSNATWGIDRVDQRNLPLSTTYTYNTIAAGVHAYIIDTGVLVTHTEFAGLMCDGFDAVVGVTTDCNGHGTHVAGTVGGTTYGVAKGVTIHPVRVLGCTGSGTWDGVIAGMNWVAANRVLPAVANMSLGGGANTAVDAAVANLSNAGVTVVVAAGNNSSDACGFSPARAPAAITVGSTTSTDAASSFTNWGACLDIFAPGSSITSAWHTGTTATNTISGTSMASPHVAGAAALYLAGNPGATPAQVTAALIANATQNAISGMPGSGSPNRLLFTQIGPAPGTGPDLHSILRVGASGKTEVHILDGATTYRTFKAHIATALHQTGSDASWAFDLGDYNRDGTRDLYVIKRQGASNTTEVHVLNGANGFQSFLLNTATALHVTGTTEVWAFDLGDYNRDGILDLYAINRQGASNTTEVHVLNGANNFQSFLGHHATALGASGSTPNWVFKVGDYNRDGIADVYGLSKMGGSGKTEVHVLNGANGYASFLVQVATALGQTGTDNVWSFDLGDYNRDGIVDVFGIFKQGASNSTEVHVLNGANNYQNFLLNTGTVLGPAGTNRAWEFLVQP
ncbi:MAG: hypothetical protein E6Q88_03785 [Lysobacteraceae bacterium]|nr:MAG: hypothetical protein E6Q88_03785 [Xanthomonadaceae bacterium]